MIRRKVLLWLCLSLAGPAWSKPDTLDHVVLVDVSGSMRQRGYSTAQAWSPELPTFLGKLLQPEGSYFGSESHFTLRPFSDTATDTKEQRAALGPAPLSDFATRWPQVAPPGGGATDMARALDLGQLLLQSSKHPGVIWLITDNENNFTDNQSDKAFYERLRDHPDYEFVYLFPLADPTTRPNDCLVMYMLVPRRVLEANEADALAKEVEKRTGYGGMLFRPLYSETDATTLDFAKELTLDAPGKHRIEQEGGQTVLYFEEGQKLQGNLRFRIRSRLKGWRVEGASLKDAEVQLQVPPTYVSGSNEKLSWQVTPKTLEVEPEKDSLTMFNLQIAGPGGRPIQLSRRTTGLFSNLFASYLPEIQGDVRMTATLHLDQGNLKHQVPPEMQARLTAVPRLAEVEQYMLQQEDLAQNRGNDREIQFQRKLVVRVKADPTSGILVMALLGMAGLGLLGLGAAALLWKITLSLEGPGVEEEFTLGGLSGQYLVCDSKGQPHCRVHSKLGSLTLVAEPESTFEDDHKRIQVRWEGDEFRFETGIEGKPLDVYWLRKRNGGGGHSAAGDGGGPL